MAGSRIVRRTFAAFGAAVALVALLAGPDASAAENANAVAVVIGNRDYSGNRIPPVDYAHRDADAIKAYLVGALGYREGNVIDLRNATQAQMTAAFGNRDTHQGRLWQYVRPGESDVTVFYSGHGVPGLKDRRGYLLPVDADPERPEINGYPLDVLYENLGKLKARSVTVYLDTCFSGDSGGGMLIRGTSGIAVVPRLPKPTHGLAVVTAAEGDQVASWDEEGRHGLFTAHLLKALGGAADAKPYGDGDGRVTLSEVKAYLDREMTYAARRRYGRVQQASVQGPDDALLGIVPQAPVPAAVAVPVPAAPSSLQPAVGVYPRVYKPGDTFKDCADCPEMVVVPAGSFEMGSNDGEAEEKPVHRVAIRRPFAVGKYEVTQAEWMAVMGNNPSRSKGGHHPVEQVNWDEAQAYVKKLSAKTGKKYRLLSETEWEYAARAGTTTAYPWGNSFDGSKANNGSSGTAPVGGYSPNAFGLYDMVGNVWEWVEDCWNDSYVGAPTDGSATPTANCVFRVLRGGSWNYGPRVLRSGARNWYYYGDQTMYFGFRVARTL